MYFYLNVNSIRLFTNKFSWRDLLQILLTIMKKSIHSEVKSLITKCLIFGKTVFNMVLFIIKIHKWLNHI